MVVRILQRGFNFSQDGPGNRLVYHLQGCTMRCPWCANPESIPLSGCVMASGDEADALCPFGAVHGGRPDASVCARCEKPCLSLNNPHLRLSCVGMTTEEILREVDASAMLFFDGGGVTFTGGEATVQFDALRELLTALHEKGVHTALETNGSHPDLPALFDRIGYLIVDCKHWDDAAHRRVIGASNAETLRNIRLAAQTRAQLLVRIPLIGGFNSTPEDAERFADALSCLGTGHDVEILRYHEYGKDKWAHCGMDYTVRDAFISDEVYRNFCGGLRARGLHLIHT